MAIGGGYIWWDRANVDSEGFVTSDTVEMESDAYAVIGGPIEIDEDVEGALRWMDIGGIKVEGTNNDPHKGSFIGIGDEADVEAYLADVEYDEITEMEPFPKFDDVEYERHPGNSVPADPTSQTFWAASAHGDGTQTLEWEMETGDYWVVLMNEDGTAGINVDVEMAVEVPRMLLSTGIAMVICGIVAVIGGTVVVVLVRRE